MRVRLDWALAAAADDRRDPPDRARMLDGVAGIQHRRHLRQARGAALAAGLVAVWVLWWNPHLHQDDPRTLWPVPSLESQASPHQAVTDSLDFASDGSFDVPLAVVRSRCGMSTDDHVRPLTQGTVWGADTVPGGSDLIIENDGGRTRHCHVGYNRAARTTDENWADLGPRAAAVACAENVGLDLTRWDTLNGRPGGCAPQGHRGSPARGCRLHHLLRTRPADGPCSGRRRRRRRELVVAAARVEIHG